MSSAGRTRIEIAQVHGAAAPAPVLRAIGLGKVYGTVTVLTDISLDILPGEIHAVIGENGAGKSTFMRLLSGYAAPSAGTLEMNGAATAFSKPEQAQKAGIVLVHQEILLADGLSVAENLFLGRELMRHGIVDDRSMLRLAAEKLAELGCFVSPRALVRTISLADRQLVQIARALLDDYRLVIFDEPTAVLTGGEVERLLSIILRLKERGIAILYISHRLDEVQRLADKVTVLRDGKMIGTYPGRNLSQLDMAKLMVGRDLAAMYPERKPKALGEAMLEVRDVSVAGCVHDVSFSARKGEILGFAGMIGAGRTELFEGITGLCPSTGTILLEGRPLVLRGPRAAMDAGIGYLTEDRKGKGLLLNERLAPNLTLAALNRFHPGLMMHRRREQAALSEAVSDYDIRLKSLGVNAGHLSGGNQQKLLLAKILLTQPSVVIIDEPTRGIDIANKAQIYAFIHQLVEEGRTCIVISSEMQELIGICDRILVMRQGRIAGEVTGERMTEHDIALLATTDGTVALDEGGRR
ncbi:ABC transporter ATP-binding protein [Xaviernesmea oryzae]|uniref:ABC transporter ATP-binding protein n=1 Tax=Xaviernesmea oryzae TaxID=464029 RepID=A0A1Q9ARI8_9HYPH|nr:sugar ABC transporter ATP-binding protein [Xaviernesmea oryzae]OLP58020.1 ABC transporter ATP-binding protein [Xaviernesmea oryzae]